MATMPAPAAAVRTLNVNVGIMGHVDAGKTSLVRALSTELSTASLDKHPQSQERGITLDLGFSAFIADAPPQVASAGYDRLQFTLVDCPGHASLIRTIIGGAQIIDMMILVVDIVKGIQTQTAECLVIGEIATDRMIVVLNKVDMLPPEGRAEAVERITGRIRKVLASTKFSAAPFIVLSAAPGGGGKMGAAAPLAPEAAAAGAAGTAATSKKQDDTVKDLVRLMHDTVAVPRRDPSGPFLFAVDHCFPIKGQGTVMTGTVLSGSCKVNDSIELAELRQERKIKSMQMFHKPVSSLIQGDRAGICVTGLDASLVERGLACTPGSVPTVSSAIALVRRIRFFKGESASGSKFHVTAGHHTVMAAVVFFGASEMARTKAASSAASSAAAATGSGSGAAAAISDGAAAACAAGTTAFAAAAAAADADAAAAAAVEEFDADAAASTSGSAAAGGSSPLPAAAAVAPAKAAGGAGAATTASSASAPAGSSSSVTAESAKALEASVARRTERLGIPLTPYDWSAEYLWQESLLGGRAGGGSGSTSSAGASAAAPAAAAAAAPAGGAGKGSAAKPGPKDAPAASAAASAAPAPAAPPAELVYEWQWAALLFESPIPAPLSALVIGSRLDADLHGSACRLAFYGRLAEPLPSPELAELARCRIYKRKLKQGVVDRIEGKPDLSAAAAAAGPVSVSLIGNNLFAKGTDMNLFVGLKVHTRCGQEAVIESAFGKTGKFKLSFPDLRRANVAAAAAAADDEGRVTAAWPKELVDAVALYRAGRTATATASAAAGGAGATAPAAGGAAAAAPSSAAPEWVMLPSPLPPVKAGDPLLLRYRKYMYGGASAASASSSAAGKHKGPVLVQ